MEHSHKKIDFSSNSEYRSHPLQRLDTHEPASALAYSPASAAG